MLFCNERKTHLFGSRKIINVQNYLILIFPTNICSAIKHYLNKIFIICSYQKVIHVQNGLNSLNMPADRTDFSSPGRTQPNELVKTREAFYRNSQKLIHGVRSMILVKMPSMESERISKCLVVTLPITTINIGMGIF